MLETLIDQKLLTENELQLIETTDVQRVFEVQDVENDCLALIYIGPDYGQFNYRLTHNYLEQRKYMKRNNASDLEIKNFEENIMNIIEAMREKFGDY